MIRVDISCHEFGRSWARFLLGTWIFPLSHGHVMLINSPFTSLLILFLLLPFQIVGFVLILSPVYSKVSDLFTSWPIVGGTIACGVFIMLIASAGIYGAVKHHQIVLFFVSFTCKFVGISGAKQVGYHIKLKQKSETKRELI